MRQGGACFSASTRPSITVEDPNPMNPMFQFVVECKGCPARIALPNQNLPGTYPDQPYWPTGESRLWILCQSCGSLFGYSLAEIHRIECRRTVPSPRPTAFWRATLACGHESCSRALSVHMRTAADMPRRDVEAFIFVEKRSALASLVCPSGHKDTSPRSLWVDRIG